MSGDVPRPGNVAAIRRAVLERRLGVPRGHDAIPRSDAVEGPLTHAQRRLWLVEQLTPRSAVYLMPSGFRLRGELDARALERALDALVRRHESLRTGFIVRGGEPVQVVAPARPFALAVHDLSAQDAAAREAVVVRYVGEEARRPFDLERPPLLRATLLRLAPAEHVLLLVTHHLVSDGWSQGVVMRELAALYRAFTGDGATPLREPPVRYLDFAAWQGERLQGDALERSLAYWRAQLAGVPAFMELPLDAARPPVESHRGAPLRLALPSRLRAAVAALARREGATALMVHLAAFGALLAKYSGQGVVPVATPLAGRTRPELEEVVGLFVNTLPMRVELADDPGFRTLLGRVREQVLGAQSHADVPFDRLLEALGVQRSLAYTPLLQAVCVMDDPGAEALALPGINTQPVATDGPAAKFELALAVPGGEGEEDAAVQLEYATDLFTAATAARILKHYLRLLEQALADPDRRLSRVSLLTRPDEAVLRGSSAGPAAGPVRACLHERFAAQAAATPEAVAVSCGACRLTYGELDRRANRLARHLRRLGAGPEVRVGVCVERSPELVVAVLGVLKAGAAYVPLDPAYPPERLKYLLEDSAAPLLVTEEALQERLPAAGARPVCLDRDADAIAREGADVPESGAAPANLAYVIYTSGSTGRPKGVMVEHRQVVRLLRATGAQVGFAADDVWALFHSAAFDMSVWELWGALLHGGRLVVVPHATSRDPAEMLALLERERVTVLNQTPAAFRLLVEAEAARGTERALALRLVTLGGEALDPRALTPWVARRGDAHPVLANLYGITETTVHATWRRITRADVTNGRGSPIGEPLSDLAAGLLDRHGEPVAAGLAGELCVGGPGVARGYLGRPALTAERFVPDPFSGVAGARMYRSGDRARRLAAGELEYLGRLDQQVKVRGFRIEPAEVEAALATHPGVRRALVMAHGPAGEAQLVAYVAADPGGADEEALRAHLQALVPEHLVPSAFVRLDAFPLTGHGKVDRAALPAPDFAAARRAYLAPRTPQEARLAALWGEVLGVERVGVHDGFFALGGDSIRSIRLLARLGEEGMALSLADLVRYPTVAGAAGRVAPAGAARDAGEETAPPFALLSPADRARLPADVEDAYPLAQLQAGMLFHAEVSGSALYHNVGWDRVRAPWDEARLRAALRALAARHPLLRTSFHLAGFAEPLQLVHREVELPLTVEELGHLDAAAQEAAGEAWIAAERARPFRLEVAPLVRFHVQLLGDGTFRLGMTEHHAILDGWSVALLSAELLGRYGAADGADAAGAPPRCGYRDFVRREREALASGEERRCWEERLAEALPGRLPRGSAEGVRRGMERLTLPAEESRALRQAAEAAGVPLKSLLLAAHLRVLGELLGRREVTTAVLFHGRPERSGGDRLLGLFLNPLPLALRLEDESWGELARRAWRAEREILPLRHFPAAELQRMNGGEPWSDALFNLIDFRTEWEGVPPGSAPEVLDQRGVADTTYPLAANFDLGSLPGRVRLELWYDAARTSPAGAAALRDAYALALAQIAAGVHRAVGAAPLASADALARLRAWGDGGPGGGGGCALPTLFAEQARRRPDAVALAWDEGEMTYAELERRANRLARAMARRGVRRGDRVGVCLERTPERVAVLLAVLKAGAAYLALEPEHPPARGAALLRDAGAALLVTRAGTPAGLEDAGIPRLRLDVEEDAVRAEPAAAPGVEVGPDDLAYIAYTSGSTGTPKGVAVPHRAVVRLVRGDACAGTGPGSVMVELAPVAFDASTFELWGALLNGARLFVPAPGPLGSDELASLLRRAGADTAFLTPTLFNLLVDTRPDALAPLRRLQVGGEAASPDHLRRALDAHPELRLENVYGPTENTTYTTRQPLTRARLDGGTVPIGRPIAGTTCHVVDAFLHPAPPGMPGELCAGGEGVAAGYLGRPGATAERFIPDPFAGVPGARMYRTGDRACWRDDGALEHLGRIDRQVKVRGFRVEPGEVEAALRRLPEVRDAAVDVRAGEAGGKRLVAWVAAAPGAVTPAGVREALRRSLPEAMVPSAFVMVDALPLTPAGKVDRRALAEPDPAGEATPRTLPRDEVEAALHLLWTDVLERPAVGVDDDFFDLGGDSLQVMRLIPRIREVFRVELPIRDFFAARSVAATARALVACEPAPGRTARVARLFLQVAQIPDGQVAALLRERQAAATPAGSAA